MNAPAILVERDGAELVIRVRAERAAVDALVALSKEGLAPFGLELKAIAKLVADGKLKTVRIGRRNFTKASYLVALVDELPAPTRAPEADDLIEAATKRARRRTA